ncbi:MAG TPA: tetratricopeptide repeat protein, partial [Ktedonobacteraceae bacterium]|nr:tetratricopeptide repeat protein [Ktedonobacteraceae bacterium]
EDETLRQRLVKHLRILQRQNIINIWHDRNISAGTEWEQEIEHHLNAAHLILLLISPDFIDSDYCYGREMKRAMERHEQGEAHVIPIILRPVYWHKTPFGKLQALPSDGKPITSSLWPSQEEALFDASEGIRIAVEEISAKFAKEEAMQCVFRGNVLYDEQRYDEAIDAYEQALLYDPACFQAHNNKGSTLGILLRNEEAIASFSDALQLLPNDAEISKNLGLSLLYLNRPREAIQVYEKALSANPKDRELGRSLSALRDELESKSELKLLF